MNPHITLLALAVCLSSSVFGAQAEPVVPPETEKSARSEAPPPQNAAPATTPASGTTTAESAETKADAGARPVAETPSRESKPAPVPAATRAPAVSTSEISPSVPTEAAATAPPQTTESAVAVPSVAPTPTPATVAPVAAPPVAVVTPAVAAEAAESRAELLAARVSLMEQLLLAQHDREVNLYRDTIRMVTIFGGAFAGLCMIGLLAAAFLNYRALMAVQGMYGRIQSANGTTVPNGLLPAPSTGAVPGIERVQASGQRFQNRMTGLEQRLAELEHMTGRDAAGADQAAAAAPLPVESAAEMGLTAPPRQVVPRAMILVHKAQTQANLGKLSEALATLDEASAFEDAKTEVHLARGQVLEKLGRLGDALKAYDHAVDADEQNTSALLLKAGVLNRQERFSEALACYERALEVHRAAV